MAKLTCALIGCGSIAREHLTALAELETVEVAAVCDLSPARAEATAERFGIPKWYSDYRQLLADVHPDLMHITTPPSSHFDIAERCLSDGLNVLCEKPMTINYSDFCRLKLLAEKNHCMLIENQQNRYHSSVTRLHGLVKSGKFGDLLEIQIYVSLNIVAAGSAYMDRNAPHFALALRGGVVGDFLPHIAYLTRMFTGPVSNVRSLWVKYSLDSPLPADEFRGLVKGEHATAYVSFSGNAQPDAFLLRIAGTQMRAEANLFEPPRVTFKRRRAMEPALGTLVDGLVKSYDVCRGSVAGFWRKLAGTSSYDGLIEMFRRIYSALETRGPQPVSLDEIDEVARLVDQFTQSDLRL